MGNVVTVVPSGGVMGADIEGVDLREPVDAATFAEIEQAWFDHQVLRFRGHDLDDAQLARFSANFGVLDMAPITAQGQPPIEAQPEIAVISNVVEGGRAKGSLGNSELVWHQDMSYNDLPPKASLLYSLEVPDTGGETLFHSLYHALELTPASLRERLRTLQCKHPLVTRPVSCARDLQSTIRTRRVPVPSIRWSSVTRAVTAKRCVLVVGPTPGSSA